MGIERGDRESIERELEEIGRGIERALRRNREGIVRGIEEDIEGEIERES